MTYLIIALSLYPFCCFLFFIFQKELIFFPSHEDCGEPRDIGIHCDEFFIESGSEKIHLWYSPHPEAKGEIIFFHGNSGNISTRLGTLRLLHSLGFSVTMFDYRGYGKSSGKPSEENCYSDSIACINWLCQYRNIKSSDIIYLGRSLGGAVATYAATQYPPQKLILESTFTSISDMGRHLYPFLPIKHLLTNKFSTIERIGQITVPTLHIHSPEDETIPFSQGRHLYQNNPSAIRFLAIRGPHGDGFLLSGDTYTSALQQFLSAKSESSA